MMMMKWFFSGILFLLLMSSLSYAIDWSTFREMAQQGSKSTYQTDCNTASQCADEMFDNVNGSGGDSEWVYNGADSADQHNATVDLNDTYTYNATNVEFFGSNYANIFPLYFYICYSNDNFSTQTCGSEVNGVNHYVWTFSNGVQARYWRFVGRSAAGGDFPRAYSSWLGVYGYMGNGETVSVGGVTVVLNAPSNDTWNSSDNQAFNYTPKSQNYAIVNATLWSNFSGGWSQNNTNASAVANNSVNSILVNGVPDGYFIWNVVVCDNQTIPNCSFAEANYTLNTTFIEVIDVVLNASAIDFIAGGGNVSSFSSFPLKVVIQSTTNVAVNLSVDAGGNYVSGSSGGSLWYANYSYVSPASSSVLRPVLSLELGSTALNTTYCNSPANTTVTFTNSTGEYYLNSSGYLAFAWEQFSSITGYSLRMRLQDLEAGQTNFTIYCGGNWNSENESGVYQDFAWMYTGDFTVDQVAVKDATLKSDGTNSSTVERISSYAGWGYNHTDGGASIYNTIQTNVSSSLYTCRVKFATVPVSYTFLDYGGGYFSMRLYASKYGCVGYDNQVMQAASAYTDYKENQWYLLQCLYAGGNMSWWVDGVVNSSIAMNDLGGTAEASIAVGAVSTLMNIDECGFLRGQTLNVTPNWLRVYGNNTVYERSNGTIGSGFVNSFEISNLTYSNSTSDCKTEMTTSFKSGYCNGGKQYSDWINIPDSESDQSVLVYSWLQVPAGQTKGTYSTKLYVKVEKA